MTTSKQIIQSLHEQAQQYTIKELVEITGLDKATIRKIRNNVSTGSLLVHSVIQFEQALKKQRKIEAGKRALAIANKLTPKHRSLVMSKLNKARAL